MKNNQLDIQVDIQDDFQDEFQNEKNLSCSIFLEQIELINQLPLEERGNVLYMAVLNSFVKNQKNQLDNQLENTYISISISLSKSISILSKSVLNILNKTIICKKYKNNWGGNRKGSGRPTTKTPIEPEKDVVILGEYNNVVLVKGQYETFLAMCASEKMQNELINSFSINIEVGKERPYNADLPNAHFERLKSYYNYRKMNPNKFTAETDKKDVWARLEEKYKDV